jgi:hypothetical protein
MLNRKLVNSKATLFALTFSFYLTQTSKKKEKESASLHAKTDYDGKTKKI